MKAKTKVQTRSIVTIKMSVDEAKLLTTYLGHTTIKTTMTVMGCQQEHAKQYNDVLGNIYDVLADEIER